MNVRRKLQTHDRGSVLIIVLWVSLGLVTLALYFANSMSFEMRAADNRVAGMSAEQAIEAGARYAAEVLATYATNGFVPPVSYYYSEAVPVGGAHFWFIGRPTEQVVDPDQVFYSLVDESAKLNLNTVNLETLQRLTNMTEQYAANIYDWRDTNGNVSQNGDGPTVYAQINPSYMIKNAPYESIDELKLVYPMDTGLLFGEDRNLNGALDPGEMDTNRNNAVDPGILEYVTVFAREPNTAPDGSQRVNVSNPATSGEQLRSLLETNLTSDRLTAVLAQLGITGTAGGTGQTGGTGGSSQPGGSGQTGGGGGGDGGQPPTSGGSSSGQSGSGPSGGGAPTQPQQAAGGSNATIASPLAFYRASGMTPEEFAAVAPLITVTNASMIYGRVNVNTAPAPVLACLPGIGFDLAQQLVNYRQQNAGQLTSIAWVIDALGANNDAALEELAAADCITTQGYQFTADIAAVGQYGRGYRRVKYVFDVADGTPRIIYRQDLSHLGWALGRYARHTHGPLRGVEVTAINTR